MPFFFLPDSIAQTKFLNDREKEVAFHFVARNQRIDVDRNQGVRLKEMFDGIKDPKSYLPGIMYFAWSVLLPTHAPRISSLPFHSNVSYASLPLFVPTIISELGIFTDIQSNGLSAPPYLLCFFYIITICFISDWFKMRGPFVALSGLIAAIGFIVNATSSSPGVRYFSIFFSVQIFASVALLLAWVANIHATESKRAGGYTVLATLGQCGPVLGTNVFPSSEEPRYRKGLWISAAFCLLVTVVSIILSSWLIWENKKMDREGVPEVEEFEETSVAREDGRGEKHRYIW